MSTLCLSYRANCAWWKTCWSPTTATPIRHQKNIILFIAGITWDYLKFAQFHDADDFLAPVIWFSTVQTSNMLFSDGSHLSSEMELEID